VKCVRVGQVHSGNGAHFFVNCLLVKTVGIAAVMIDILCSHACCDDVYTIAGTGHSSLFIIEL
jgi:hypothetical protein